MRIIGGKWRSRRLARPQTPHTRPMPDRVREAIFNMLGSHYGCAGALPPIDVADLFAGSGSMGLEALSRGASTCVFVERSRAVLSTLRQNLDALSAVQEATLVGGDAWAFLPRDTDGDPVDLLFLDPPYSDADDASRSGQVWRYMDRLAGVADVAMLVVLHHRAEVEYTVSGESPWRILDQRTFGGNGVTFFLR